MNAIKPPPPASGIRDIPYMGVIYVVAEAMKLGFYNGHPDWCNLGQGQPEVGDMTGAPARIASADLHPGDHAYGHINGVGPLRDAIAGHYNRLFRAGRKSRYTADNVAVAAGGRLMLSRIFAAIGSVNVGYQTPDYTAYEDMLDAHRHRFTPVHAPALERDGFMIPPSRFEAIVREQGLGAFIFSNPCNPTGQVIKGDELAAYVDAGRQHNCLMIFDEFYSHFIYTPEGRPGEGPVSAASFVGDIEDDPVLIVDGLTKSFRYPGWRVGWALGPKDMIDAIGRAASALDGGPPAPVQRMALKALEAEYADQETAALRRGFAAKRNLMLERLKSMGVRFAHESEGTFYLWGSIADLPAPYNDVDVFFREGLRRKVMTVPGRYFDVNPGKVRTGPSPLAQWVRFSFGPPFDNVRMGLDRLEAMVASAR